MTITIEVAPEIENRLQEEADKVGLPVQDIVLKLVQDRFSLAPTPSSSAWKALVLSMGVPANVLSDEATRRESIYED